MTSRWLLAELRAQYPRHRWQKVNSGESGDQVWRLSGEPELFVKLGEVADEAQRLEWLAAQDIPTAHLIDAGHGWLVTRAVPGRRASDPWEAAARTAIITALADLARRLHALSLAACPFERTLAVTVPLARTAVRAGTVDLDDLDDERQNSSAETLLADLEATTPTMEDLVVCHGDFCLPNVLIDPVTLTVTGVIDVGRLGVADRYQDLGLMHRSLGDHPANTQYGPDSAALFLAAYGVDPPDAARLAFYRLLDEFF